MPRLAEILLKHRLKTLGAAVVLLVVGWLAYGLWAPHRDLRVEAIRRQGYPVTRAELDAWYPAVPDSENAALVYTNAFALLPGNPANLNSNYVSSTWPPPGRRLTPDEQRDLAAFLAEHEAVLKLLHSVPTGSRSRYPIDFRIGPAVLLPHLAQAKRAVQLLTTEALLHASSGDGAKATEALLAAGRVADSLSQEPILISYLVRLASWNWLLMRLEHVLELVPLTDEQLGALQKMVAEAEQPGLLRSLAGERGMHLPIFTDRQAQQAAFVGMNQSPAAQRRAAWGVTALFGLYRATGVMQKDRAYYLETGCKAIAAAEAPYPERFTRFGTIQGALTNPPSRVYFFSRMMLPSLSQVYLRDSDSVARIRTATAGLAVERFRRAHGGVLPDGLDALAPACIPTLPADPFTGKLLRFTRDGAAYAVYSVGPNLKDDGGVNWKAARFKTPLDVAFVVQHQE